MEGWYVEADTSVGIVIAFHGYASSKDSLLELLPYFNQHNYDCFLVDFFGSGGSSGFNTTIGFLEAADVKSSVKYIQSNFKPEKILLYGISMGSVAISKALSDTLLGVNGIVLESTYNNLL